MWMVAAVTSKEGYQKVIDIMNADEQLAKGGGKGGKGGKASLGNDNYYLALFGTPSVKEPWMVHFGGRPPRTAVAMFRAAIADISERVRTVALAMCGASTTLGRLRPGWMMGSFS